MDLLSSLGTLAGKTANITLPGLVAALAFALLLWPPQPVDRYPTVITKSTDDQAKKAAASLSDSNKIDEYLKASGPACEVTENGGLLSEAKLPGLKDAAVLNQLTLEDTSRDLQLCSEREAALEGLEDQMIKSLDAEIATAAADVAAFDKTFQNYGSNMGPLEKKMQGKKSNSVAQARNLQAREVKLLSQKNERARRKAEYQRLADEMKLRLGEPGRLRPKQKFDDILAAFGNHIVGFLTLIFASGLLIDPINRALFGFFYDNSFDTKWDEVRPERVSVGQQAQNLMVAQAAAREPPPRFSRGLRTLVSAVFLVVLLLIAALVIWIVSKDATPSLGKIFGVCAFLFTLALLVAYLLPNVLRLLTPAPVISPDLSGGDEKAADDATRADGTKKGNATPAAATSKLGVHGLTSCAQKLARDWHRVSQPAYAIGTSLMQRSDYKALQDEYYGQSVVSSSLLIPVWLLAIALLMSSQLGIPNSTIYIALIAVDVLLFLTAVDRRHKFLTEYENIISATYLTKCAAAAKKAAGDDGPPSVASQISTALKTAKIVEEKNLHIIPADAPVAPAPEKPAATPDKITTASSSPASDSPDPANA